MNHMVHVTISGARRPTGRKPFCLSLGVVALTLASVAHAATQPNILWITAEDMSSNLGCYGDRYATTPCLDNFAKQSVRYTHAFATAPVCSPARSCLITGLYATSLGTQRLRSEFPLPAEVKGFPAYLRAAGYFTSNNVKTDYNIRNQGALVRQAWDRNGEDAHWRQRRGDQPFFSVFNLMTTHQSRANVWPEEQFEKEVGQKLTRDQRHDPEQAPVPPYYPDIPSVRKTLARYYDCITVMDQQMGEFLNQLEEDGVADDTIVFFYADHGMGMPRGKRVLHDTGMHVPMIIRFPEKYRELAPAAAGQTVDRLVSFVDFAPTVLSLAGIGVPETMQGRAFLGEQAGPLRQFVFGARDRVDEVFDLSRSVRNHRYLYIRNYMPHLSWMPPERYSDNAAMRRDMKRLRQEGKLNAAQLTYASPTKPVEEFYDTETDPHQVKNLAGSPEHQTRLDKFRQRHRRWIQQTRDAGFLPESEAWRCMGNGTPRELAQDRQRYPLERILHAASLVGDADSLPTQVQLLADTDPAVRYWAVVGLHAAEKTTEATKEALRHALDDVSPSVCIEAASGLAAQGETDLALATLVRTLKEAQVEDVLRAMRGLQLMGAAAQPARPTIEATLKRAQEEEARNTHPVWMFVRFSAEAALEQLP